MNAIVLSGGVGSRLAPLTENCPKPCLPLANRPVLDYVISHINAFGINRAVFTLAYKPEIVKSLCDSYRGIEVSYSHETKPLGTAGAVKLAQNMLDETFLVISGDGISNIDLERMAWEHERSNALVTMAVTTVQNPSLYGVVRLNENKITGFVEKPKTSVYGNLVNTGVYIVNKSVLSLIPDKVPFDFSRNLFPSLVGNGLNAYIHDGYWCDVGDINSYYNENFHLLNGGFYPSLPSKVIEPSKRNSNLVGKNTIILGKVRRSIIGNNVRIASSAEVDECVILDGATVTGKHFGRIIGENYSIPCKIPSKNPELFQNNRIIFP